jgi:hypothetical protein
MGEGEQIYKVTIDFFYTGDDPNQETFESEIYLSSKGFSEAASDGLSWGNKLELMERSDWVICVKKVETSELPTVLDNKD